MTTSRLRDMMKGSESKSFSIGGHAMGVRYEKLFQLLAERNMTTRELQKLASFSGNITTRMKRNEYISLESIEKICRSLQCRVDDILEFD